MQALCLRGDIPGFVLALAGMALSVLLESLPGGVIARGSPQGEPPGLPADSLAPEDASPDGGGKIFHILIVVAAFIALMLLFERLQVGASYNRILVATGIFSAALERSGMRSLASPLLRSAAGVLGAGTLALVALLIVAFSIVGVHPFISIVPLGEVAVEAKLPLPMLTIAMSLAIGGAAAYMVSPFAYAWGGVFG